MSIASPLTMPNFVAIGQIVAEISRFWIFHAGGRRHLGISKFPILTVKRVELYHHAKFGRNRLYYGRDVAIFRFFQDGGRPPSWICNACVGTTHEGHLVLYHCANWLESMQ